MSANPDSDPDTDADPDTPRNAVEDLQGLLLRLQMPQMYTEPSVVQTDICLDHEKLMASSVLSPQDHQKIFDDISNHFSRIGWLLQGPEHKDTGTGLHGLRLTFFEIGYMLKPDLIDRPNIKPNFITQKMNWLLSQLTTLNVGSRKDDKTFQVWLTHITDDIAQWNTTQGILLVPPHLQKKQVRDRQFHKDWVAWTSGDQILYTKDGVDVKSDVRSHWVQFVNLEGIQYYKPINGRDCYAYVPRRESQKDQIQYVYPQNVQRPPNTPKTYTPWRANTHRQPPGVYRDQYGQVYQVGTTFASQESTSDLADLAAQVRPCRCEGCPGCDGTPADCRCIGTCRCVHDA
jgi:hypothetical protein